MKMNQTKFFHMKKKRRCFQCGKLLGLLEGHRHPTFGGTILLCYDCFIEVLNSVEHWGRFVLWNSFNPDAPDPTYLDTYPFPEEPKSIRHKPTVES